VIRGGIFEPKVYSVDAERIIKGEKVIAALEPGDIIFVPKTKIASWNDFIEQIKPSIDLFILSPLSIARDAFLIQQLMK